MKISKYPAGLVASVFAVLNVAAESAPMPTPPAPPFRVAEAAGLGDEYVAKKFPQFPTLYCSHVSYNRADNKESDPSIIWRLRYVIPINPAREVPGSPFYDWGVCVVFVHKDKSVTHTLEPKQNPK